MQIPCSLTDVSGTSTTGEATLTVLSTNQRFARSAKRAATFFGIALVCVLIPMLHFVLVPTFLLLSIFFFVKTMKEKELVTNVRGECPACHQTILLDSTLTGKGSKEICPNCRQLLKIAPRILTVAN